MFRREGNRGLAALILAAALALAFTLPAEAGAWKERPATGWEALWVRVVSWLGTLKSGPASTGAGCESGASIDPDGCPAAATPAPAGCESGASIDPNGCPAAQSTAESGLSIDPNGAPL
jgi:hypothetical protein